MVLMREFENNFFNLTTNIFSNADNPDYPRRFKVQHGTPFAQIYGMIKLNKSQPTCFS